MTILQAIILGIIEGITEFLPISSTGHLLVAAEFLKIPPTEFVKTFIISIQLGAIFSVAVLYAKKILTNPALMGKIALAFVPTAIIGVAVYPFIKILFAAATPIIGATLIAGGLILIAFELFQRHHHFIWAIKTESTISWPKTLLIGLFQSLAVIPGVSRSGATIIGGLLSGIERTAIVEFSFLLAIPTMLGATGWDLIKTQSSLSMRELGLLALGFATSFVVALAAVKWLLKYIQNHNFIGFGIYRIAAGILIILLL